MKGLISTRNTLWWLVFIGFSVNYMMRINLNIAIVSMVKGKASNLTNATDSCDCLTNDSETECMNRTAKEHPFSKMYSWDEYQQNLVLGAFFWLHWLSQIPGGVLAQRYGTKLIFGLSNLFMCFISLLIPMTADVDYRALIFLRVIQGLIGGMSWPSMHTLTANWIPPNERSRFVTAYMGGSIGVAFTYPLCGLLIDWLHWPAVFYVTSVLGIIWFIAWWLLVYDTPEKHPSISITEKLFIVESLKQSVSKTKPPIPWMKILKSYPMWINVIVQWGNIWSVFTLMTQTPTYFKNIHGWDIRMTGLWSGLPHFCRVIFTYVFATITDYLLYKSLMSRTNVRKLSTSFGCIGQGIFFLVLAFCGSETIVAIVCVTVATALSGAASTGSLASFIDMSPNFASIMLGICNMICTTPGFISPIIVGTLTYNNQTTEQWQLVFLISVIVLLCVGFIYLFCSNSELQSWNSPKLRDYVEELQLMNGTPTVKNEAT